MTEQTIEHNADQTDMFPAQTQQAQATPAQQAPVQPQQPQFTIEQRIEQYIKLRDAIKAEDDKHKARMKPARESLEMLNNILLQHLTTVGIDSARCEYGTVYKTVKRSASLEDPDAFMRHVIGSEAWELLDRKVNLAAAEAFAQENGVLPPGVKMSSQQVVGVRRS